MKIQVNPTSARKAEAKIQRYDWTQASKKPEVAWINVGELEIDHSYQREKISEPRILAIASQFNWTDFGALIVMRRGKRLYVVDGQHRLLAARRRGDIKAVPCTITESGDLSIEARCFADCNSNRSPIGSYNRYRAELAAGNQVYVEVQSVLGGLGLRVTQGTKHNGIAFPTRLVGSYVKNKGAAVSALCATMELTSQNRHPNVDVFTGLFYVICRMDGHDISEFTPKLIAAGGDVAIVRETSRFAIELGIFKTERTCGLGVLSIINRKRHGKIVLK